jgi:hypothetical protein
VSALQKPDATRVAGLYAWNQLGRKVKKGERGIRILSPMVGIRRKKGEEADKDIRTQNHAALVGFRAYVFERLSRDLRSGFYAPDQTRDASRAPSDGNSIITQFDSPAKFPLVIRCDLQLTSAVRWANCPSCRGDHEFAVLAAFGAR